MDNDSNLTQMSRLDHLPWQAIVMLTALTCICAEGIKMHVEQEQAFIQSSETEQYYLASTIECALQCVSATNCNGANYRVDTLQCSLNLSPNCSLVADVGSVFIRNPLNVQICPACSSCIYFGSSAYMVISTAANWGISRDNCIDLGGKLYEIETQEENDYLKSVLPVNTGDSYWIGAYNFDGNGGNDYKWITKQTETMVFTDWGTQWEPDNRDIQRCLSLWRDYTLKWGTHFCVTEMQSVCEFE